MRWAPAAIAAFLVSASLTLLRVGFARGVALLTSLNQTYGSLSAIVIFVIAIGIMTTLFLGGVSLAHAIQYRDEFLDHDTPRERTEEGGRLYVAVRLLLVMATAWKNDRATRTRAALADEIGRPEEEFAPLVAELLGEGLLTSDAARESRALARARDDLALCRRPRDRRVGAPGRALGP